MAEPGSGLANRIEVSKLAHELKVSDGDLAYLTAIPPEGLRRLRRLVSEALFSRQEERLLRLASASRLLPAGITAKIAQHAMGPSLSARIAGAMDPAEAAKLASHFEPEFLTAVAISLDPTRVSAIVKALPEDLVIDVGRRLMAQHEHLVLGRFVSIVSPHVTTAVAEGAPASDLLQVALYSEDTSAFDSIIEQLPQPVLADLLSQADEIGAWEVLGAESRARLVTAIG